MGYCPNTPEEIREMLAVIGAGSVEELFSPIPQELRAKSFELPAGHVGVRADARSCRRRLRPEAPRSSPSSAAALRPHHPRRGRPPLRPAPSSTPPTPRTSRSAPRGPCRRSSSTRRAICRLTGMEASNASLYDGGTAVAEAALMALRITGRQRGAGRLGESAAPGDRLRLPGEPLRRGRRGGAEGLRLGPGPADGCLARRRDRRRHRAEPELLRQRRGSLRHWPTRPMSDGRAADRLLLSRSASGW